MSEPTIHDIGRRYRSRIERATKAAYRDAYALNKTAELESEAGYVRFEAHSGH
jgi:hypothetical protein